MRGHVPAVIRSLPRCWRLAVRIATNLCALALLSAALAPRSSAADILVVACDIATAINAANAGPGGDRVLIPQGTCTLSAALPKITKAMTIEGQGSGAVIDAGTTNHRVLEIDTGGGNVNLSKLTIRNGKNQVDPAAPPAPPAGPAAAVGGGITWNARGGVLTLDACTLDLNTTEKGDGGGIAAYDSLAGGTARLVVTNSTISNNTATDGAGGGLYVGKKVDLVMTGTLVQGNKAGAAAANFGQGGGLFLFGPAASSTATAPSATAGRSTPPRRSLSPRPPTAATAWVSMAAAPISGITPTACSS
jgi:hypothetical protein